MQHNMYCFWCYKSQNVLFILIKYYSCLKYILLSCTKRLSYFSYQSSVITYQLLA